MQIAPIALLDGQSTPATVTFYPAGYLPASLTGKWATQGTSGVAIGQKKLQMAHNENAKGIHRAKFSIVVPVVQTQTVDGVSNPVVVDWTTFNGEMISTSKSTEAARLDTVAFAMNLMKNPQFVDAFVKQNDVY